MVENKQLPDIFLPEAESNTVVYPARPNNKGSSYLQNCRDNKIIIISRKLFIL